MVRGFVGLQDAPRREAHRHVLQVVRCRRARSPLSRYPFCRAPDGGSDDRVEGVGRHTDREDLDTSECPHRCLVRDRCHTSDLRRTVRRVGTPAESVGRDRGRSSEVAHSGCAWASGMPEASLSGTDRRLRCTARTPAP
jgi:hypothetical protein